MDFTLTRVGAYPNGTSVGAYPVSNWPGNYVRTDAAPPGSAAATATMTNGEAIFTGLTPGGRYVSYAEVGGKHRYMSFLAGETEGWHEVGEAGEPAFENSWVNSSTTAGAKVAFYKDELGRVHLRRLVKDGTVAADSTGDIFTLPVGYRPLDTLFFAVNSNSAYGLATVHADGSVRARVGSSANFSLSGISFLAEQ